MASGNAVDVITTTITDLQTRPAAQVLDRRGRRRKRPLSLDSGPLSLDGNHTDLADRARAPAPARRRARLRVSGSSDDGSRGLVPDCARSLRVRAPRHVRAAPAQGAAEAGTRCHPLPGRCARRRSCGGRFGTSSATRSSTAAFQPTKVHVRGNGFPEPAAAEDDGNLRSRLGIPGDAPIILYVGRIAAGKGIEHLLEAARASRVRTSSSPGPTTVTEQPRSCSARRRRPQRRDECTRCR